MPFPVRCPRWVAGLSVPVLLLSTVGVPVAGAAPSATPPSSATLPAPAAPITSVGMSAATSAARVVTLPTGERLSVRTVAGRTVTNVLSRPDTGIGGSLIVREYGDHRYVLPAAAVHYGNVIDESLFDVAVLPAGRIPITLETRGAATEVPGVTITSRTGSSARGYLSTSSAAAFGRALAQQWLTDVRTGTRSRSPLGLRHVTLTGASPPVRPNFVQVTLKLRLIGPDAAPVDGYVGLVNLDDSDRYYGSVSVVDGEARVSLPKGHYALLGGYQSLDARTGHTAFYAAVNPDYTVQQDGQSLTLDERTATATPRVSTPRPASLVMLFAEIAFRDAGGLGANAWYGLEPGDSLHITPTAKPRHGTMHLATNWIMTGAPTSGPSYTYDLSFDDAEGIPADLRKVLIDNQLVTLDARYYSDGARHDGAFGRTPLYPFQGGAFGYSDTLSVPVARTEYLNMSRGVEWDAMLNTTVASTPQFTGQQEPAYTPGRTYRVDWLRGPLAPGIPEDTATGFYECPACRTSTRLFVAPADVTDTTAGHAGAVSDLDDGYPLTRLQVFQDGRSVLDGAPSAFGATITVPAGEHTYRVVEQTDRGAAGFRISTHATTDWTFVSSAGDAAALPTRWHCDIYGIDERPSPGRCGVLALMAARVFLPTDLNGAMPVGGADVVFTVGHIQGARTIAVTSATLSISTDGVHFVGQPVIALGGGRYRAHLTTPKRVSGTGVSIRVTGTDAARGSITRTVQNAYTVAEG